MSDGDRCPTCGQPVRVVTAYEGTSHYAPGASEHEEERLREALRDILAISKGRGRIGNIAAAALHDGDGGVDR